MHNNRYGERIENDIELFLALNYFLSEFEQGLVAAPRKQQSAPLSETKIWGQITM